MSNITETQKMYLQMRNDLIGTKYMHFKGNVYIITDMAIHTETGELMVIYKNINDPSSVWCRPLDMFTSEVDREKYPDVKQHLRFERIN